MIPRRQDGRQLNSSCGVRTRRGTILITALVCLLIVTAILGSMLQRTLRASRQLHAERDRRQTELLLQAGVDRAALRLATEPDYRGETWNLAADAVVGSGAGRVTIEATHDSNQKPWQVQVVAEYPLGSALSVRRSRAVLIPLTTTQAQE